MDIEIAKSRIKAAAACYARWKPRGPAMLVVLDQAVIALGGTAPLDRAGLISLVREFPYGTWMHASMEDGNLDDVNLVADLEEAFSEAVSANDWYAEHAAQCLRASVIAARAFLAMPDEDDRYRLWCEATRYPYRDEHGSLYEIVNGKAIPFDSDISPS